MSTRCPPSSRSACAGIGRSLTNARDRPPGPITRRTMHSPARRPARVRRAMPGPACSSPSRTRRRPRHARRRRGSSPRRPGPPTRSPSASTRIDFPAPVSPVSAVIPGAQSSSRRSMTASDRIVRCESTTGAVRPMPLLPDAPSGSPGIPPGSPGPMPHSRSKPLAPVQLRPQCRVVFVAGGMDEAKIGAVACGSGCGRRPPVPPPSARHRRAARRSPRRVQHDLDHAPATDHDGAARQRMRADRDQHDGIERRVQDRPSPGQRVRGRSGSGWRRSARPSAGCSRGGRRCTSRTPRAGPCCPCGWPPRSGARPEKTRPFPRSTVTSSRKRRSSMKSPSRISFSRTGISSGITSARKPRRPRFTPSSGAS